MFAVIKTGGKQYIVKKGDFLDVEKLNIDEGKKVIFDEVLLIEDKGKTLIGTPHIKNAQVRAEIVENFKDKKVIVFKKKRRKQYKKKTGHRQELTRVKIEQIVTAARPAPKKETPPEVKAEKKAPAKKKEVVSKPVAKVKKEEKPRKEVKKEPAKKAKPQEKAKAAKPKEKKVKTAVKKTTAKSSAKTSAKIKKKT